MLHVFLVGVHNEVNEHVKQRQEVGSTPTMGELSSERSFSSRQAFNRYRAHVLLVGVRINTGIPVYCIIIRGRKISRYIFSILVYRLNWWSSEFCYGLGITKFWFEFNGWCIIYCPKREKKKVGDMDIFQFQFIS